MKKNIETTFSNFNLRGKSFKGMDLKGADFSGSDIRGADFTEAILNEANFTNVQSGIRGILIPPIFLVLLVLLILSAIPVFAAFWWFPYFIIPEVASKTFFIPGIFVGLLFAFNVYLTIFSNEEQSLLIALNAFVPMFLILFSIVIGNPLLAIGIGVSSACILIGMVSTSAGAAIIVGVKVIAGKASTFVLVILAIISLYIICAEVPVAILEADKGMGVAQIIFDADYGMVQIRLTVLGGFISIVISSLIAYKNTFLYKNNWIMRLCVFFISIKGTQFRDADLTDADFSGAELKSTNFTDSIIIRTRWKDAKNLEWTRKGKSYLNYPEIRELLVTLKGDQKAYNKKLNLIGLNLKDASLNESKFNTSILNQSTFENARLTLAEFAGASLMYANLRNAVLKDSKLVKTHLDSADLRGAELTGACIEDWNITETTKLEGVDCDYIFLEQGVDQNGKKKRRQPANERRDFDEGEFSKYIVPLFNTLDLFHNKDANPHAIAITYDEVFNKPGIESEIISIEKKGDSILFRLNVSDEAIHSELAYNYEETYEQLKALPSSTLSMVILRNYNKEAALLSKQAEQIINPIINQKLLASENSTEIKGKVEEELIQLSTSIEFNKYNLKNFLQELRSAFLSDPNISGEIIEVSFEQLFSIVKSAQYPENLIFQQTAETAFLLLEGIIKNLPITAKPVAVFNKVYYETDKN